MVIGRGEKGLRVERVEREVRYAKVVGGSGSAGFRELSITVPLTGEYEVLAFEGLQRDGR